MAITRQTEPWSGLLDAGRADERLVREAYEGARPPRLADIPPDLHPKLLEGLEHAGIEQLYAHQAQALEAAWEGATIVTTGTASGKSLCFNLPTLEVLCTDAKARYYNVQVFRNGKKILSAWPSKPHYQLRRSWRYRGHRYRLSDATYRWYLWAGYGKRSARHYGGLLGKRSFIVR